MLTCFMQGHKIFKVTTNQQAIYDGPLPFLFVSFARPSTEVRDSSVFGGFEAGAVALLIDDRQSLNKTMGEGSACKFTKQMECRMLLCELDLFNL